jgi:hypothetical protein
MRLWCLARVTGPLSYARDGQQIGHIELPKHAFAAIPIPDIFVRIRVKLSELLE